MTALACRPCGGLVLAGTCQDCTQQMDDNLVQQVQDHTRREGKVHRCCLGDVRRTILDCRTNHLRMICKKDFWENIHFGKGW